MSEGERESNRLWATVDAVVGVVLWPGIAAHEYAHVLACRAAGVRIVGGTYRSPLGDVYVDHEPVESFPADLAIALAPLVVNSLLAVGALGLAGMVDPVPFVLACYYLGACFAVTALPSSGDTETLLASAAGVPRPLRAVAYAVAAPVRGVSVVNDFGGVVTAVWLVGIFATVGPTA